MTKLLAFIGILFIVYIVVGLFEFAKRVNEGADFDKNYTKHKKNMACKKGKRK